METEMPFSILSRETFKSMELELLRREAQFNTLMAERDRYCEALRVIAEQDYRGNKPFEIHVAQTALGDPRA